MRWEQTSEQAPYKKNVTLDRFHRLAPGLQKMPVYSLFRNQSAFS